MKGGYAAARARRRTTDVVVVGAGSAGASAAIAAAESGADVVLVDRLPIVGGTSTAVLDTLYAFYTAGSEPRRVVGGIGWRVGQELLGRGAAFFRPNSFGSGTGLTYDPEALKVVWNDLLAQARVTVLTGTVMVDAEADDSGVEVTLAAKGGLTQLRAVTAVDGSGDGDLALACGAKALQDNEFVQPATMTFRLGNVDEQRAFPPGGIRMRDHLERAEAEGVGIPGIGGSVHRTPLPGVVLAAMTRVPSPRPDDVSDWREAEVMARRQVQDLVAFLRGRVPGFEHCFLIDTSDVVGVRETRRIRGRHVLTEAELLDASVPPESIALCGAPIEDLAHQPTRWRHVPEPGFYGIPLGTLLPDGLGSIAVAGRCLSATHEAHSSARSMATCMAMGQAAGTLAALAANAGKPLPDVPFVVLRNTLIAGDAILDLPVAAPEAVA